MLQCSASDGVLLEHFFAFLAANTASITPRPGSVLPRNPLIWLLRATLKQASLSNQACTHLNPPQPARKRIVIKKYSRERNDIFFLKNLLWISSISYHYRNPRCLEIGYLNKEGPNYFECLLSKSFEGLRRQPLFSFRSSDLYPLAEFVNRPSRHNDWASQSTVLVIFSISTANQKIVQDLHSPFRQPELTSFIEYSMPNNYVAWYAWEARPSIVCVFVVQRRM